MKTSVYEQALAQNYPTTPLRNENLGHTGGFGALFLPPAGILLLGGMTYGILSGRLQDNNISLIGAAGMAFLAGGLLGAY
jgi:hypothetical protein